MLYYHIWVRSDQFRGNEPLTYRYDSPLAIGTIVSVPLRKQHVLGIVSAIVPKPSFPTKEINETYQLQPLPKVMLELAQWLHVFYASPIGVITQQLLPQTLPKNPPSIQAITEPPLFDPPPLTAEQQAALSAIVHPNTYLLHGRTGSGKTRIYLELAKHVLEQGRSVLVLSPEIGLASQLTNIFQRSFGSRVITFHSQLTPRERQTAWYSILSATEPIVVVGPRSTLFSPLRDIGLIVIDEAHDQAYKQEQAPYYQANRVAAQLRQLHRAFLVLGSATPAVNDYFLALERGKPILRLTSIASSQPAKRSVVIVDLKNHEQFKRAAHLSLELIEAIARSLERHEQVLLYINRRGTARLTLCMACGWQALCPNCDIPLTYHGDDFSLRCHSCNYRHTPIISCPECGNPDISLKSFGTKAIVDETKRNFPDARIIRFDTDNLKPERLEHHYQSIINGEVDILIGTQVIAKGLDLPRLSTLGVILADTSLYLPDFTAQERTYQLLNQVLGRIGRGHTPGVAVIQSYAPNSKLLRAALDDDWETFYTEEIKERKKYFFPPFCHLLKLSCRRSSAKSAEKAALLFRNELLELGLPITIEGPAPAFHEKVNGSYRWQLVVKSCNRHHLLTVVGLLPAGWSYDLDPADLL